MKANTREPAEALNLLWATLLVEEFVRCGVRVFALGSGSRSSPLAVAVARNRGGTSVVHVDERGAAFYALGVARATGRPAVWITTSGSAVANGFPAVVEADSARVPLILVTADRPPELRDTGANQTIQQAGIFGRRVRWEVDLPCPTPEISPAFVLTTVDQAVHRASGVPAGPVHLNCMFREPLLPDSEARTASRSSALHATTRDKGPNSVRPVGPGSVGVPRTLRAWAAGGNVYTRYVAEGGARGRSPPMGVVTDAFRGCSRGVIVAGELTSDAERKAVCVLARAWRWPLLPDITSGLRLGRCAVPRAAYVDQILLSEKRARALRPDAVLHLGGAVVSKRLQQFLAAVPGPYVHVRNDPARLDPEHRVDLHVEADVAAGCRGITRQTRMRGPDAWVTAWLRADARAAGAIAKELTRMRAISEPGVARAVSQLRPAGHGLFVASSMPVRDLNMYGVGDGPVPRIGANRGASGIDGTVATAAGFAAGLDAPVTVLLGDLALLHDLNSLALAARSHRPLTIVVINNNGGGIFSFLPVAAQRDVFESHFGTPHGLRFAQAAAMYGLAYAHPESPDDFAAVYRRAVRRPRTTLIEVTTDRADNVRVHEALQARVRAAV